MSHSDIHDDPRQPHPHGHHGHEQTHGHGHEHASGQPHVHDPVPAQVHRHDHHDHTLHAHPQGHAHHHGHAHMHDDAPAADTLPMTIAAVGAVRSSVAEPHFFRDGKNQGLEQGQHTHPHHEDIQAEIVIDPQWEELLDGIQGYSHIMVLYWPHLLTPGQRQMRKVHPMGRKDIAQQGIFATRSPARPNPILVTVARLLERRGSVLVVQGLEAVDGSPVLDIKPHTGSFHAANDTVVVPDWMAQLQAEHAARHRR